ncbi:DUF6774 domain-containing protein, partial [Dysosmobacter welbionis]
QSRCNVLRLRIPAHWNLCGVVVPGLGQHRASPAVEGGHTSDYSVIYFFDCRVDFFPAVST